MVSSVGKTLSSLGAAPTHGAKSLDPSITDITTDSRRTKAGTLFAALPGVNHHGGEFIQYAIRMEAAAILTDSAGWDIAMRTIPSISIPVIVTYDPRLTLAKMAARFFERQPATMIAVTGTNGKTSVANFTRQLWESLGKSAANFGTAGVEGAFTAPLSHTTPEPVTLHKLLAELADAGITHAAMEASSHGLDQKRLDGVYLTAAGFTNFTQDHLDYHHSFDAYFEAKAGLFDRVLPPEGTAVINIDDAKGAEIVKRATARGQDVISIGSENCDMCILGQRYDSTGQDVRFSWKGEVATVRLNLIGGFQAQNALMAAGLVIACGEQAKDVISALGALETVPGRMQLAATRQNGAPVFVDYAHTPDAVETALKAMRPHIMGRLIVALGAGGDRDTSKRVLMGQAAATHADVVFVTDDNPRSEDPALIRDAVMAGCPEANNVGDRAQAILRAIDALGAGDALLIAGKGHETGQVVGDDILPFNDVEQASVAVAALDGLGA